MEFDIANELQEIDKIRNKEPDKPVNFYEELEKQEAKRAHEKEHKEEYKDELKKLEQASEREVSSEHDQNVVRRQNLGGGSSSTPNSNSGESNATTNSNRGSQDDDGFDVSQTQDESLGLPADVNKTIKDGSQNAVSSKPPPPLNPTTVDWVSFMTIPKLFDRIGGDRPVQISSELKKSQVSGILDPLFSFIQGNLKGKFLGAEVNFPWGKYEVKEDNKVFTTKSTLIRYLMFDALRDHEDSHVQYARQWLVLNHTMVYSTLFKPDSHMPLNSDELDIYCILLIANSENNIGGRVNDTGRTVTSEFEHETEERLQMLNSNTMRILDRLRDQEQRLEEQALKSHTTQTVLLLDRMGLLKGGMPKDLNHFAYMLEQNRNILSSAEIEIDDYMEGEKKRQVSLDRQRRMDSLRKGNFNKS